MRARPASGNVCDVDYLWMFLFLGGGRQDFLKGPSVEAFGKGIAKMGYVDPLRCHKRVL